MKRAWNLGWMRWVLGAVCLLIGTGVAFSDDKPKGETGEKQAPTEEDWMKLTGPDEHHQQLDVLVGNWKQLVRVPGDADGQWTESAGKVSYKWVLGGRFLMEEATCDIAGTQFEWLGLYGYDKVKKKYTAVWADNFGTATDFAECDADASGKVFAFAGEQVDPMSGKKQKFRWVITIESKDKVKIEMFEPGEDRNETKSIEIIQTRA